jgi:hypothetical protein
MDLEVNENGIYVSVAGASLKKLKIYHLDLEDKITKIGNGKMGVLGKDESNNIWFAQTYQYIDEGDAKGYGAGDSYIGYIKEDEFQFQFHLTNSFTPTNIEVIDQEIYLYSYAVNTLYKFSNEGTIIEILYEEESSRENRGMFYFTMNKTGAIFISDSEKNVVYKIGVN